MLVWKCSGCHGQMSASPGDGGKVFQCPRCGTSTTAPVWVPPTAAPPYPSSVDPLNSGDAACSRLVYILLAVFLGKFGVHNFVAGYTFRGLTQLLITLGCVFAVFCTLGISLIGVLGVWIWAIIEVITVTTDSKGRRMP